MSSSQPGGALGDHRPQRDQAHLRRRNEVCVFYDFVTETPAGAVASVEWLTIAEDRSDRYRGDAVRRRLLPDTDVGADFGC
jgi:hypothetical protein